MKRLLLPRLALLSAFFVTAACETTPPRQQQRRPGGFAPSAQHPAEDEPAYSEPTAETRPDRPREREREPEAPPKPPPSAPAVGDYQYGKSVPGKPGFVTSPYAPYQGYVD